MDRNRRVSCTGCRSWFPSCEARAGSADLAAEPFPFLAGFADAVKGKGFFTSKALGHGQKFSHRFTTAGRFDYLCTLHPTLMAGTIVVSG